MLRCLANQLFIRLVNITEGETIRQCASWQNIQQDKQQGVRNGGRQRVKEGAVEGASGEKKVELDLTKTIDSKRENR